MLKKFLLISSLALYFTASAQTSHTVVKGDNLYNISKKYGMSLKDLMALNPSVQDGKLKIGDVLKISKNAKTTSAENLVSTPSEGRKLGKITIKPKQTLYGLTKQYRISEADLRKLNPNLEMKIGEEVVLPLDKIERFGDGQYADIEPTNEVEKEVNDTKKSVSKETEKESLARLVKNSERPQTETDGYITHTVVAGETVFGIINKYGVTLDELLELNPELSNGLKAGTVIKIKKIDKLFAKKNDDTFNVVLMLPFGFSSNDTKMRTMATDFLMGAKLAIEKNAENGKKLDIKVIDAGNETSFKNSLTQINTENTDLIVGPFLKSNVMEVLRYVDSKKIPVVAPFANSEELYDFSNLIIATPTDDVYAERIAKEVSQVFSNQKIYVVAGEKDKENANLVKAKIEKLVKKPNVLVVDSSQEIQLDKNMMTGQNAPIIAVVATTDDKEELNFTNKIIALSKEVSGLRAFSTSYHPSFEKKVDELSQANLVYLMDRKINTEGSFEKGILSDYREKYCKAPSKYAIIGFDVVNDILSRENGRGDVFKQIGDIKTQLATKFEYVKAKANGAYINTGYRVVRLVP